jgi:hypothetical protein
MAVNRGVISAVLVGLAIVIGLSTCSSKKSKMEAEFMDGCESSNVSKAICHCVISKIEEEHSTDELIGLAQHRPDLFVKEEAAAAPACISQ